VSPGVPVATVGNLDSVEISIQVTEERINGIEVGQSAQVSVDAAGTTMLTGKVYSVSPFKDPRTMLYSVKVLVPNEEGLLKSGMFARARLTTAVHPQVVTLPEDAVVFRAGRNVVYILEGDRVKAAEVKVGATSMGKTSVKGISPGTQIVVEGQEMLQDEVRVLVEDRGASK
jgi:RND family efflux transporter MFP subunit